MRKGMKSIAKLGVMMLSVGLFTSHIQAATLKSVNQNNTTLVPLRIISQELGAQVDYNSKNKEIRISYKDTIILTTIGSKKATVNGNKQELRVAPQIISSTTYVPLRFIGEALGGLVDYKEGNLKITLGNQEKEWTLDATISGRDAIKIVEEKTGYQYADAYDVDAGEYETEPELIQIFGRYCWTIPVMNPAKARYDGDLYVDRQTGVIYNMVGETPWK